jgi:hypothetical protein
MQWTGLAGFSGLMGNPNAHLASAILHPVNPVNPV